MNKFFNSFFSKHNTWIPENKVNITTNYREIKLMVLGDEINILIGKLQLLDIKGVAKDRYHSYLFRRKQCVDMIIITLYFSINMSIFEQFIWCKPFISEQVVLIAGVPQCSILGPVLFFIYLYTVQQPQKCS